jgi:hypothetical protein
MTNLRLSAPGGEGGVPEGRVADVVAAASDAASDDEGMSGEEAEGAAGSESDAESALDVLRKAASVQVPTG